LVFYPNGEQRNPNARRILRNHYVVELAPFNGVGSGRF
jgi:hypothetical protein